MIDNQPYLLDVFASETVLTRKASTDGGEYAGPCPFCGGTKHFRVWPEQGRWWCRECERKGDAIQFIRERYHLSFKEACQKLGIGSDSAYRKSGTHAPRLPHPPQGHDMSPPSSAWQEQAWAFTFECQENLMEKPEGGLARSWLHDRGFTDETLWAAGLGYNLKDRYLPRESWGLSPQEGRSGKSKKLWLPRGITIPWTIEGQIWKINIRRPVNPSSGRKDDPKYVLVSGSNPHTLYNAGKLSPHRPAILVEGDLDALSIQQEADDLIVAVAAGTTTTARTIKWIAKLAQLPQVLVSFDTDDAGNKAAIYWLDVLSNGRRWKAFWDDPNAMLRDGADVRGWIEAGLRRTAG